MLYSWNEGESFVSCNFSSIGPIEVDDIIGDPRRNSQIVSVLGSALINGVRKGVVFTVDFSDLHERPCVHPNDYYSWTPSTARGVNSSCYLGEQLAIVRRRRDVQCYNPDDYEVETVGVACACTKEDYECDYCFEKQGGVCVYTCEGNYTTPPENCAGYYQVSQGYRLISGDKCQGGLNLHPQLVACPASPTTTPTPTPTPTPQPSKNPIERIPLTIIIVVVFFAVFAGAITLFLVSKRGRKYIHTLWGKLPSNGAGKQRYHRQIQGEDEPETEKFLGSGREEEEGFADAGSHEAPAPNIAQDDVGPFHSYISHANPFEHPTSGGSPTTEEGSFNPRV